MPKEAKLVLIVAVVSFIMLYAYSKGLFLSSGS
jgi:hypothetical protein